MRETGWSPIFCGRRNLRGLDPSKLLLLSRVIGIENTANNGETWLVFLVDYTTFTSVQKVVAWNLRTRDIKRQYRGKSTKNHNAKCKNQNDNVKILNFELSFYTLIFTFWINVWPRNDWPERGERCVCICRTSLICRLQHLALVNRVRKAEKTYGNALN